MLFIIVPTHKENEHTIQSMLNKTRRKFPKAQIIHVRDTNSLGKGCSIRTGFKKAEEIGKDIPSNKGHLFAYIDGDKDIDCLELNKLLAKCNKYDIVVGKKKLDGLLMRKIVTFFSRIYIRLLFGIGVDTQTGIKLFRQRAISYVKENGFLFDILMLKKAKKNGHSICQVPVNARIVKHVSPRILFWTFIDSLRILRTF